MKVTVDLQERGDSVEVRIGKHLLSITRDKKVGKYVHMSILPFSEGQAPGSYTTMKVEDVDRDNLKDGDYPTLKTLTEDAGYLVVTLS